MERAKRMTAKHTGPITAKGLAAEISAFHPEGIAWSDLREFGAATWNHKFTAAEAADITEDFRHALEPARARREPRNPRRGRRGRPG